MRLLSRVLFTFALLGGLAFGSYAFGKHVLSSKLFGNKGSNLNQNFGESTVARSATRSASRKSSDSAIASVEVLPESGDGGAPSKPDSAALPGAAIDRSNTGLEDGSARPGTRDVIGDPSAVIGRDRLNASDATPTSDRPRRRRRRRKPRATPAPEIRTNEDRTNEDRTNENRTAETPAREDYSNSPDAVVSQETAPREASSDPAPRVERSQPRRNSSGDSNSDSAPADSTPRRRRRTRTRITIQDPPRTRVEPRRETPPTRRNDESPVPVPEGGGGGGGESPVPVPE